MPDEMGEFQTAGLSWEERAEKTPGVAAVYSPTNLLRSTWLALVHDECLRVVTSTLSRQSVVLDFGCGIGRHLGSLSAAAGKVIGADITRGMLKRAVAGRSSPAAVVTQIDGYRLPMRDQCLDAIWICGVLRYSLLVPKPRHREISQELYRVLKPGGIVANVETYVDRPAFVFTEDFRRVGFRVTRQSIVHVHNSRVDRLAVGRFRQVFLNRWWAYIYMRWSQHTTVEARLGSQLRDYFFIYRKP